MRESTKDAIAKAIEASILPLASIYFIICVGVIILFIYMV